MPYYNVLLMGMRVVARYQEHQTVLLGGSWDLVSKVINKATILINPIKVLITLLTKLSPMIRQAPCLATGIGRLRFLSGMNAVNSSSTSPGRC